MDIAKTLNVFKEVVHIIDAVLNQPFLDDVLKTSQIAQDKQSMHQQPPHHQHHHKFYTHHHKNFNK